MILNDDRKPVFTGSFEGKQHTRTFSLQMSLPHIV